MGSWGVGPLENDRALDDLSYIEDARKEDLDFIATLLLNSRYEEEVVLGAVMILNAWRRYDVLPHMEFFESLNGNEDLKQLVGDANNRIYDLIQKGATNWIGEYKSERIKFLKGLKEALADEEKRRWEL